MAYEKKFLSLEEVADLLGVTYQLIYRLVRAGELPAIRVGKLYRISSKDLDAYLDQSRLPIKVGGACSLCGRTYHSRLSLVQSCIEPGCEAPICVDCWDRNNKRCCQAHSAMRHEDGKVAGGLGE